MKSQLKELHEWIENKQIEVHNELMSETESIIYCTLQLVKRQIEYQINKDNQNTSKKSSPGWDGC
jgi:hypothetical protein